MNEINDIAQLSIGNIQDLGQIAAISLPFVELPERCILPDIPYPGSLSAATDDKADPLVSKRTVDMAIASMRRSADVTWILDCQGAALSQRAMMALDRSLRLGLKLIIFREKRINIQFSPQVSNANLILAHYETYRKNYIKTAIWRCFTPNNKGLPVKLAKLQSTPLYANGYIDLSRLPNCPKEFCWVVAEWKSFFRDQFVAALTERDPMTVILFVNFNSGPFALAAANAIGTPFVFEIDRFGPQFALFEDGRALIQRNISGAVLLVSDFILGGSEVKIALGYSKGLGLDVVGVSSVLSFYPPQDYEFHRFGCHCDSMITVNGDVIFQPFKIGVSDEEVFTHN